MSFTEREALGDVPVHCLVLCRIVLEGSGVVSFCAPWTLPCVRVPLSLSHLEQWIPSPSRAHLWLLCSYEQRGVGASGRCLSTILVFYPRA